MDLYSDLKAKKSLGQNFLKSEKALNSIIAAADLSANDFVVEIGPGKGALTSRILETGATVLAIEKDGRMIEFLQKTFTEKIDKELFLIEGDVLETDLEKLRSIAPKYKLIANIPYYITGAIIRKFLSGEHQPEKMVLLVQKEVAERIVAKDGKESLLSISVKAYCEPKFIEVVKAGSFVPAPSVDSAILLFNNISKKNFFLNNEDVSEISAKEERFFEVLHAGFAHKRKKLGGNLKELNLNNISEEIKNSRAETLKLEDWLNLLNSN